MRGPRPATVESVHAGSPAAKAGLRPGDRLLRVNARAPRDYIEYRYLAAEARVRLLVRQGSGRTRRVAIEKAPDDDLGLSFTEDVFDGIRRCRNRCPFCFVSQLPKGLRPALYVRDDDYRLSFLHGNFVTLTNLTPADRRRIVRWRLSPLYVSVHATEPEVRKRLFGRQTPDVVAELKRLAQRGIEFHAQIVVCPGINDGPHLERTVHDLAALHPGVRSVGVVPVGLTRHRDRLPSIRRVCRRRAAKLVRQVHGWQGPLREKLGTRFVFAADELYLQAGLPVPSRAHYEGLWQLGNGIGCARLFLDQVSRLRPPKLRQRMSVSLVTGELAAEMVRMLARKLEQGAAVGRGSLAAGRAERRASVTARVCVVRNRLLGRSVTVAGLLAGQDIARSLRSCATLRSSDAASLRSTSARADLVIIPDTAVREGEGFLDGMSLEDLSRQVKAPVLAAAGPRETAAALREFDRGRHGP